MKGVFKSRLNPQRSVRSTQGIPLSRLIAIYLISASVGWLIIWRCARWQVEQTYQTPSLQEQIDREFQTQKHYLEVVKAFGSLAFVLTAYLGWQNWQVAQEKQVAERFSKAVEMLGDSENIEKWLGGIYSLERIALDSPEEYHWTIMEILTAFVREKSPAQGDLESNSEKPKTDIQAALTVIGRTGNSMKDPANTKRLDLSNTNLRGVNLQGANLQKFDLQDADLRKALLRETHLEEAWLDNAKLQEAKLEGAYLEEASLTSAHLEGAVLIKASLREAVLLKCHLEGADISEADLSQTKLAVVYASPLTKVTGMNLVGAKGLDGEALENLQKAIDWSTVELESQASVK